MKLLAIASAFCIGTLGFSAANAAETFNIQKKTLEYNVAGYHIQLKFLGNNKLRWEYLNAPKTDEVGKHAIEDISKDWVDDNTLIVRWTEDTGAHVVDVFDFERNKLYASFVLPDQKLYHSNTSFKFVTPDSIQHSEVVPYQQKDISFKSGDNNLKGILFTPDKSNGKAVTLIGPVSYVKEQAPLLYAKSLASKGYTALIYDPTYHGESEGTPRHFESGEQKTKDIIASIDYLAGLDIVEPSEIYGVGICQGVNWMINASNQDPRIKAVSLVAGHYLDQEVAELYTGGKERLAMLLEKSKKAKEKFVKDGMVEYVPIVGTKEQDSLLTAPHVYDWYIPWENNSNGNGGKWVNKITLMSMLDIWSDNVQEHMTSLEKPTMMIHSNKAASGPNVPKRLFKVIPAEEKELVWLEDQPQTSFYEDQPTISRVVTHVDGWFQGH